MNKIKVIIVDDEPLSREAILVLLQKDPEVDVVNVCADGLEAVRVIREEKPDLVFLDVQMPRLDGFGVLAKIPLEERPTVIFVTAYDQHAIRAFENCALDYLLKPFADWRFAAALARAKDVIRKSTGSDAQRKLGEILSLVRDFDQPRNTSQPPATTSERVVLKSGGDLHFLVSHDLISVEAQGDFVKVTTTGQPLMVRETLGDMEQRLDAAKFLRIHRSFLVNTDHIRQITPALYGDYSVLMTDGSKLRLSRNYRDKLKSLLTH